MLVIIDILVLIALPNLMPLISKAKAMWREARGYHGALSELDLIAIRYGVI